jgi:hypothetical protein
MPAGGRVASGVSGMSLDGRYWDERRREEDDLEDTRRPDELGDRLEEEDLEEQLYDHDLEQAFEEDERDELVRDDREDQREEDERRRHKEQQQAKQREADEPPSDAENVVDAVGAPAGAAVFDADRSVVPGQEPANAANRGQEPVGERWPAPSPDARRDLPGPDPRAAQAQQAPQNRDSQHHNPRLDRAQGGAAAAAAASGGNPPGPPGGPPRDPRAGGAAPADRQQQVDRRQQQQRHPGQSATRKAADLAQRASTKADTVIAMADPTTGASPRQSRAPGQGKGLEHLERMMHGGQKRAGLAATPPTKTPEARAHKGQTAGAFIKQLREGRRGGRQQQEQDGGRERTKR